MKQKMICKMQNIVFTNVKQIPVVIMIIFSPHTHTHPTPIFHTFLELENSYFASQFRL